MNKQNFNKLTLIKKVNSKPIIAPFRIIQVEINITKTSANNNGLYQSQIIQMQLNNNLCKNKIRKTIVYTYYRLLHTTVYMILYYRLQMHIWVIGRVK